MGVKAASDGRINTKPSAEQGVSTEEEKAEIKFQRGGAADLGSIRDKKLKGQLSAKEALYAKSAKAVAKSEKFLQPTGQGYLEPEGLEKTWRIKQETIVREVDLLSQRKAIDIVSPVFGPYTLDFSLSGRYMVAAGRKGHLAILDMIAMDLLKEFQVKETVRDAIFLHDQKLLAVAQKKYVYMYNESGSEMHCMKEHGPATKLQFLHKHFLLTSINKLGHLHYQDITSGQMINTYRTGFGRSDTLEVNPYNNVLGVGHSNGTVSMWKPTSAAPLVKMLCHKGPVTALAFHSNGHLMATSGMERKIKLWDLRKYEVVQTLPGHATTMDFSQKGLLATSSGSFVQVLGDLSGSGSYSPYMSHSMVKGYQTKKVSFRSYEDVLAIGHSMGWSSILVPGSGQPNFDTFVANPYETRKQRNEKEVKMLMDKLPPETIMLDPTKIGSIRQNRNKEKMSKEEREAEQDAAVEGAKNKAFKKKTKGRSKPSKMAKKKRTEVEKAKKPFLDDGVSEKEKKKRKRNEDGESQVLPKSLQRFARKVPTTV